MTISYTESGSLPATPPLIRWWEVPVATLLSLFCPGLGSVALGVPAEITTWKVTFQAVNSAVFASLILPQLMNWNLFAWATLAALWLFAGVISAAKTLRKSREIRVLTTPRRPRFGGAIALFAWVLSMLALFVGGQRFTDLSFHAAPPGSWVAPSGTGLVSIEADTLDRAVRGQLIEYPTAAGPRLGRVLAIADDWFAVDGGAFIVNGFRYSAPRGKGDVIGYLTFIQRLNDPSHAFSPGKELSLSEFAQAQPKLVPWGSLVVASDDDLTSDAMAPIATEILSAHDVIGFPLARLDSPLAGRLDLAQPEPQIYRLYSTH